MYIKSPKVFKLYNVTSYVPLVINTQPVDGVVLEDNNFNFSFKLLGSRPFIYRWYKNGIPIPSGNGDILTLTNTTSSDTGLYFCRIRNNRYTIDTNTIKLGVVSHLNLVTQPSSISAVPAETINFSMSVIDPTVNVEQNYLRYNWYKNDQLVYSSNSNLYYIFDAQNINDGEYFCVANNLLDSVTSEKVSLYVYKPIEITRIPTNSVFLVGQTLNTYLSCTGTMPVTAQWRRDGVDFGTRRITTDGRISLIIPNIQTTHTGYYDCVLSNIVSTITSSEVYIYVF
jgi:hypothetical protein